MSSADPGPEVLQPPPAEIAALLTTHPLFSNFDNEAVLEVASQCGFATYPSGVTIMRQGDPGSFALLILDGEADIFVELPRGPIHMATVGPNRIVGELGVFTDMPRTATVVARSSLFVVRIEEHSLTELSIKHPSIGVAIIRELGRRLVTMNRHLAYLTYAAEALARDEFDSAMIEELSTQPSELGAFAQVFAGMAAEVREKQHRRHEMEAAAEIQQSILPPPLQHETTAKFELHAEMHPARDIGGDFYDYFLIDQNRLAVTVADVSGKGIPASLFMAVSRTVMRSVTSTTDLKSGITEANRLLATHNTACMFVTIFHGVLDLSTGLLSYCNAGHNPPYLLRADGGRAKLGATGLPLGIDPDMPYRIDEVQLAAGDTLFVFSDGITEAFNPGGEEFGTARLERALDAGRGSTAVALVARVLEATAAFAAGADQSDDITCLALIYRP